MKRYVLEPSQDFNGPLLDRPQLDTEKLSALISDIFTSVKEGGDKSIIEFTQRYDGVMISDLRVSEDEITQSASLLPDSLKKAIAQAYENIYAFHKAQYPEEVKVDISAHISCWQKPLPIDRVGLYIPGGSAPLFSTVLMLAIPAMIAGCRKVVLTTPPDKEGRIHPAILYTAQMCGVTEIYKVGGAQAIAAMTYGTESIPHVYKVFGPGNQYVTAAKMRAFQEGIAIDMPAGPSEVLVYADDTAEVDFVASDLLSQAEHGPDSQVLLVTSSRRVMDSIEEELAGQLETLPRKEIAIKALDNSRLIYAEEIETAWNFINEYAPEHLIIASESPEQYLSYVRNAGSVFIGNWTPESAGDYASGTNHTLPTSAAAKAFSGVNLDAFLKKVTFQRMDKEGMKSLGPIVATMARAEELEAHARAIDVRMNKL